MNPSISVIIQNVDEIVYKLQKEGILNMAVMFGIVRLLIAVVLAIAAGKLISKLRLPAILGWLIAGMIMGPHAVGLLDDQLLDSTWFSTLESLLELQC